MYTNNTCAASCAPADLIFFYRAQTIIEMSFARKGGKKTSRCSNGRSLRSLFAKFKLETSARKINSNVCADH